MACVAKCISALHSGTVCSHTVRGLVMPCVCTVDYTAVLPRKIRLASHRERMHACTHTHIHSHARAHTQARRYYVPLPGIVQQPVLVVPLVLSGARATHACAGVRACSGLGEEAHLRSQNNFCSNAVDLYGGLRVPPPPQRWQQLAQHAAGAHADKKGGWSQRGHLPGRLAASPSTASRHPA